jgi:REP element-mobilizing transposase RayT
MSRSGYTVVQNGWPCFTTSSIVDWTPVFVDAEAAKVTLDSLSYLRANGSLLLHAYVVMPDHLHLIVSSDDVPMKRFLSHTAREVVRRCQESANHSALDVFSAHCPASSPLRQHKVWQGGYHPKAILTHDILVQKMDYVHQNPVRKGLVKRPGDWPYSSLAYLQGNRSLPPVDGIVL